MAGDAWMDSDWGEVGILNVGYGDIKISFSADDVQEVIRARRIVTDMLKRGYALIAKTSDGKYQRVYAFDEQTDEYVIADYDPEVEDDAEEGKEAAAPSPTTKKKRGKKKTRRIKAKDSHAVAVPRTAGG